MKPDALLIDALAREAVLTEMLHAALDVAQQAVKRADAAEARYRRLVDEQRQVIGANNLGDRQAA